MELAKLIRRSMPNVLTGFLLFFPNWIGFDYGSAHFLPQPDPFTGFYRVFLSDYWVFVNRKRRRHRLR